MGDYVAYQAYKPSNVAWLGDIPEHWDVWKVTHGFNRIGSGTTPKSDNPIFYDGDVPWVTTSELRETIVTDTAQKVTEEAVASYSALKIYPKGSLAIAMYGATIGRLGMLGLDATFNQACCVFSEPTVFDTRFVYYWLWMRRPILISLSNGGGQPNLSQDDLKKLWIPIPSIPEQQAIARFLDFKTAQIDALTAKKKSLLDKLAEKRTALVSHAVTKGLVSSVPMKDSGVAWLGNIPANWDIGQFSHFIFFQEGPGIMAVDFHDSGVPLLRIHNVQNEVVNLDGCNYLDPEKVKAKWAHFRLRTGDLLISCSASTGLVSEVDSNSEGAVAYTGIIRLNAARPEISKEFIKVLVGSSIFFEQIAVLKTGTTLQHFGPAHLRRMFITLPPINEQIEIVNHIKNECSLIDAQSEKIRAAIDLLTEYRSALITNAVTGKIDVRGFEVPQIAEGIAP